MFKRSLIALFIALMVPAFAHAWYVNSKTSPALGQGTISPLGNSVVLPGQSKIFAVDPADGFKISRVTVDGVSVAQFGTLGGNPTYKVDYVASRPWRYIVAYFTVQTSRIWTSASATPIGVGGGTVREDNFESLTNIPYNGDRQFLLIPNPGYRLVSVTVSTVDANGLNPTNPVMTSGAALDPLKVFAEGQWVGYWKLDVNDVQTNKLVTAAFELIPTVTVDAGADVSANGQGLAYAGKLYGSGTSNYEGIPGYTVERVWSESSALELGADEPETPTDNPSTRNVKAWSDTASPLGPAPEYAPIPYVATFTVTVRRTSDNSVVATGFDTANVAVLDRLTYQNGLCLQCHERSHPAVAASYDASSHKSTSHGFVACQTCHDPADPPTGHYSSAAPYGAGSGAGCQICHRVTDHGDYGVYTDNTFTALKAPHGSAGVAGATGTVSAQFVANTTLQPITCASCHASHNNVINGEYAESGHGDASGEAWWHYDWRAANRAGCARCHTTGGFVARLGDEANPAQPYPAGDTGKPGEVLACTGCHSDVSTGEVRAPGAFTLTTGTNAQTLAYPNAAASNLCVRCHAGRETGGSIANDPDPDGVRSFINSHYLAAADTVFSRGGYEYAGQSYGFGYHQNVGVGNVNGTGTSGACVACHMKSGETGHSWEVVTKDAAGIITGVASTSCASCHGNLTAAALEAAKEEFHVALEALNAALIAKGIEFKPTHPYFYQAGTTTAFTNWAGVYGLEKWKDVMGAAFNYNLLEHEPGAYAHNKGYALKLITDSIDFLNDGEVDGDGPAFGTLEFGAPHLGGQAGVQAQYFTQNVSCSACHAGGDTGANGAILVQYAESAHGDVNGEAWMHYDWASSSRASCQRCHTTTGYLNDLTGSTTALAIGQPGQVLTCAGCHTDVGTGALRAVAAFTLTTGTNGQTVPFPSAGASNLCVRCHAGRETGASIAADPDADGVRGFINSHYLAAAGTLYSNGGYEYAGQSYGGVGYHRNIDSGDACVGCHMVSAASHTWEVVAKDAAGVITGVASTACSSCHANLTAAVLEEAKESFHAALEALKAALEAQGIYFYPAHPYFFTAPYVAGGTNTAFTNWAGVYGLASWKDAMGAAFNYNLLEHEPGAYAHNRQYALKLIQDSIDFLSDGTVDGQGVPAAVAAAGTSEIAPSVSAAHAVTGTTAVSAPVVATSGDDLSFTVNVKVDGVNYNGLTKVGYSSHSDAYRSYRFWDDPDAAGGFIRDTTAVTPQFEFLGNGNYKVTIPGGAATIAKPEVNSRYLIRLEGASNTPQAIVLADYPATPRADVSGKTGCVNCHGEKTASYHYSAPNDVKNCVVCHDAENTSYPRLPALIHGIHNSHNMPSGHYSLPGDDETLGTADDVVYSVTYPTYMQNCSVCHDPGTKLDAVNAAPVSYALCMTCHENWDGFGHSTFGGLSHAGYTAAADCTVCHNGAISQKQTAKDFHNGLFTERNGLVWNGQDVSVTEGAKVNMQITGTSRTGNTLSVTWTATYDGAPVNPCNEIAAAGAPAFHLAATDATSGQAAGSLSIIRGFAQGDDWVNAGVGTSPGQPQSTTLDGTNTSCTDNVATTTIALTSSEVASSSTRGVVALQGKAQVKLATAYSGSKDVIQVRSKTPTKEFVVADGSTPATTRRAITDTASCLKCHVGSLYQHGGTRVDNVDMCVICHNEASTEQNVRKLDGVTAATAYDGKPGQTYGFKSFLHAVHSAGENGAITMCYRTNGNYVWAGHDTLVPNYPVNDVFGDDAAYAGMTWFTADDNPALAQAAGTGTATLIFGSSAPHGTGPQTEGDLVAPGSRSANGTYTGTPNAYTAGTKYQVYRSHNLHRPTYPQALNNCAACHVGGAFGVPDPTRAVATTLDAGTVGLGGSVPSQTASNATNSNLLDDTLQGPAAAACMSCHQTQTDNTATPGAIQAHATQFGFAPQVFTNGRADIMGGLVQESCAHCHKK